MTSLTSRRDVRDVIEYAKITKQNLLSKIGTPITGFIRDKRYSVNMENCLKKPSPDGKPWSGLVSNFVKFQSNFKRLTIPQKIKQTLMQSPLPGNLTVQAHAKKLFGRLSAAMTWLNNRFMRKDYT